MDVFNMINGFGKDGLLKAEIQRIVKEYKITTAIEAGTNIGYTTEELAFMVENVITVELNSAYWLLSSWLDRYDNVNRIKGDTAKVFLDILPIEGNVLFYLDAHWEAHSPLLDELEAIHKSGMKPVIVIHDFFNPNFPNLAYDTWDIGEYKFEMIQQLVNLIYQGSFDYWYNTAVEPGSEQKGVIFLAPE